MTYAPDERQRTFQLDAGDLEVLDVRYDLHNLGKVRGTLHPFRDVGPNEVGKDVVQSLPLFRQTISRRICTRAYLAE